MQDAPPPPLAPTAPQVVEEVMPPGYNSPSPAAAVPEKIEEQPSLSLDRAAPADIKASNLQAALDLAQASIPVFPVRI
jgi:hypothetical protein